MAGAERPTRTQIHSSTVRRPRPELGPGAKKLVVGVTTAAVVTLPAVLMFSWLSQFVDLTNVAPLPSIALGLSLAFVVLAMPSAGWGWVIARMAGHPPRPIIATTVRTALPTFAAIGIAVDLSQLFIDSVWQWHRLAVHGLFALAFSAGMAIFLGTVVWRVTRRIAQDTEKVGSSSRSSIRIGRRVALATGLGVVVGALLALPLDWAVVRGMGRQMLAPLYLVLAIGSFSGGYEFGRWLARAPGRRLTAPELRDSEP